VRNDCKVFQFCRAKCHRAFLKKRNPRKVKWTKAFRKAAGKEMRVDATFEFEKRRNTPVRYDRELVGATIGAMRRVKAIQEAREKRFFDGRMVGKKATEKAKRAAEIAAALDLAKPAAAKVRATVARAIATARASHAARRPPRSCYFCSSPCYPGKGQTFVRNDCKVFQFCRAKCHRAFLKKRNPRKVKWTKAFRKAAGKEMRVDATFEFEKRRNTPVRYDRELMGATIGAMKRVKAIQEAREKRFYDARMKGVKSAEKALHKAEIAANIDLIKPAAIRKKEEVAGRTRAQKKAGAGEGRMLEEE